MRTNDDIPRIDRRVAIQWMLGFPSEVVAMMTNVAHDNAEVEDLSADGYDLDLLGFGADELTALLGEYGQDAAKPGDGLTDPDDAPAVQATPVTKLGDVWVMGKHRLMCGDSTSIDAVKALTVGGGY